MRAGDPEMLAFGRGWAPGRRVVAKPGGAVHFWALQLEGNHLPHQSLRKDPQMIQNSRVAAPAAYAARCAVCRVLTVKSS